MTSTMRTRRSRPAASARRSSSPGMNGTGCGWPSLMAMFDAETKVRARASRTACNVSGQPGHGTGGFREDDRAAVRQGGEFDRERAPARRPLLFHVRGVARRGGVYRQRQFGGVQGRRGDAGGVGSGPLPSAVGEQDQQVAAGQGAPGSAHRDPHLRRTRRRGSGGEHDQHLGVGDDAELRRLAAHAPGFVQDHRDAVAAPFHEVAPLPAAPRVAGRHSAQHGSQHFVARGLPIGDVLDRQAVRQRARRLDFQPVREQRQADAAAADGVQVAVRHRVDHGLEDGALAVLGQIDARRVIVRRHLHVAHGEGHGVGDLAVQRPADGLRVDLPGRAVGAAVAGSGDAGVGEPLLRGAAAQQDAGHGRPPRAVRGVGQQPQLGEGEVGSGSALSAHQRFPQRLIQRPEAGFRNRLLVEPQAQPQPAPDHLFAQLHRATPFRRRQSILPMRSRSRGFSAGRRTRQVRPPPMASLTARARTTTVT